MRSLRSEHKTLDRKEIREKDIRIELKSRTGLMEYNFVFNACGRYPKVTYESAV